MELDFTEMFGEDPPEHELHETQKGGVAKRAPGGIATPGVVVETTTKRKKRVWQSGPPAGSATPGVVVETTTKRKKGVWQSGPPAGIATPGVVVETTTKHKKVVWRAPGRHCHSLNIMPKLPRNAKKGCGKAGPGAGGRCHTRGRRRE